MHSIQRLLNFQKKIHQTDCQNPKIFTVSSLFLFYYFILYLYLIEINLNLNVNLLLTSTRPDYKIFVADIC